MSMSTRPLRALVLKDLRVFLSDRRAVILSFVAPLALASMFAMLSPGGGGDGPASKIPILVIDQDQSRVSRAIVEGLAGDKALDVEPAALDEARERVRTGDVGVAVAIPEGFGAEATQAMFRAEDKPVLSFLYDPTHAAEAGMVRGLLTQHVMEAVSRDAFGGPGGATALASARARLEQDADVPAALKGALLEMFRSVERVQRQTDAAGAEAKEEGQRPGFGGFGAPFEARDEKVTAQGQADSGAMAAHAFAGMSVQFILFASVEAGVALLMERQRGLWRRVRAAPIARRTLLAGKAISQALIGLMIVAVVFGFGVAVFHVRFSGSLLGFLLVAAGYALAASCFGLLIAALGKTPQAARGVSILAVLVMVMLGGAWMPSSFFPAWLQNVTPLLPTRWAVDGFEGATWRGLGLAPLLAKSAALLGFAALFGALAAARFRWEED
jgi:ABC-2 type transport system permease protein